LGLRPWPEHFGHLAHGANVLERGLDPSVHGNALIRPELDEQSQIRRASPGSLKRFSKIPEEELNASAVHRSWYGTRWAPLAQFAEDVPPTMRLVLPAGS
jgi:hypothetical protein